MKFGYARVSTLDQNLHGQIDALHIAGCEEIFQEKISAGSKNRPQLDLLFKKLRRGDILVVYKLDRLGRSLKDLIHIVSSLATLGVEFISLSESINTTTHSGKLVFNIFAAIAEYERDMIRERTMIGLAAAKLRGRVGGRPKGLSEKFVIIAHILLTLHESKQFSIEELKTRFNIKSKDTFYRILEYARSNPMPYKI